MATRLQTIIKDINRNQTIPLSYKRTLREIATAQDAAIELNSTVIAANVNTNQLISGGATWVSGLTFLVSPCTFVIDGVLYSSAQDTVTLSAADVTHPRIDVLAVNTDGTVSVVAGTAAADPVKPEVDPETQVEVTFVTVAAGETTPTGVSNTDVYLEDTEWTSADSANVDAADTSDPYAGTKAIKFTEVVAQDYVTLTDSSTNPSGTGTLGFWIKPLVWPNNKTAVRIALFNGTTRASSWLYVKNNTYGFNGGAQSYQFIQIPLSYFNATSPSFNVIKFEAVVKGSGQTFLIDNIKIQDGLDSTDTSDFASLSVSNAFSAAQGSAITVLTDAATISWDMSPSNVYSVVLDGNRTMAAPTNVQPGFTYILQVSQDATTGSRTITWNAVFKWAGGTAPTLSTGTSALDITTFVADAAGNLHGSLGIADSQ